MSTPDTIATAWRSRAPDLADWTWRHLVCQTNVWGGYLPFDRRDGSNSVTKPRKELRGQKFLTPDVLYRHFMAHYEGHIVGLHSTGPDNRSRSLVIDVDCHGDADACDLAHRNLSASLAWRDVLLSLGFNPWLSDSNGRGGLHLRVVFDRPVTTATVYGLGRWLVRDFADYRLPVEPEMYPKQPAIGPGQFGNWVRLPGHHHTYRHWTRFWDGADWLAGDEAVGLILHTHGDDPSLIPAEALAFEPRPEQSPEPAKTRHFVEQSDDDDRLSDEEIAERCIKHIPNADANYEIWFAIGAGCNSISTGSRMFDAWRDWSARSKKHNEAKTKRDWGYMHRTSGAERCTLGTLTHLARQNGYDWAAERKKELREKHEREEAESYLRMEQSRCSRGVLSAEGV